MQQEGRLSSSSSMNSVYNVPWLSLTLETKRVLKSVPGGEAGDTYVTKALIGVSASSLFSGQLSGADKSHVAACLQCLHFCLLPTG